MSHFNVGPLDIRPMGRPHARVVLTRSVEMADVVGIVCKDAWRPDEKEEGDGEGQRESVEEVKVSLGGGEITVIPAYKLGDTEDASGEVGDAGKEEDVIEGGPSIEEPLSCRGVPRRPDHVTRATGSAEVGF